MGNKKSDVETSMYYCNARYYKPEMGRFLNASYIIKINPQSINELNMYTYVCNNSLMVNVVSVTLQMLMVLVLLFNLVVVKVE